MRASPASWPEPESASARPTGRGDVTVTATGGGGAADGRVDGLVSKTADLSVDVIGRTWANVGAVADGGFYWRSAIPTLAQAAALDSSYVVSVTPTASQALNFYTLLRIPDGHDSRDFRVRQVGDLGTFDTTGWHLIGSQGGFDYHYAQRNLFEGYTVTVQESVTQTTTHYRGEVRRRERHGRRERIQRQPERHRYRRRDRARHAGRALDRWRRGVGHE